MDHKYVKLKITVYIQIAFLCSRYHLVHKLHTSNSCYLFNEKMINKKIYLNKKHKNSLRQKKTKKRQIIKIILFYYIFCFCL